MNILIFGGSGRLGTALLKVARNNNSEDRFYVVTRESRTSKYRNVVFVQLDYRDQTNIERLINSVRPEWIINCAVSYADKECQGIINSELPIYLAHICELNRIKFIHLSSIAVIIDKDTIYSESKRAAENAISGKKDVTIIRLSAQRKKWSIHSCIIRIIKFMPCVIWKILPAKIRNLRVTGPSNIVRTAELILDIVWGNIPQPVGLIDAYGLNWFYLFQDIIEKRIKSDELRYLIKQRYKFEILNLPDDKILNKLTLF